ncbi:hypothetical protein HII36_51565 [Nonomuraea sp. NN258]|uniref:hypothetical protein n=1 Tax=Nonomuraea antri TaxID=2730852 RepID=UPI0015684AA9|nr:hypothetical protein [Nonomuraea antri]NRQ40208.1 hypothetical protein [Nonomuraea antri]
MTDKAGIGRITAGVVAVAAMLPYLTLKLLWLTGSSIGVNDPRLMRDPAMVGLNTMTFGMDVVALVLALAFTLRWGRRLPAWLVLPPMWVGTGLLGVIIVTVPFALLVEGFSIFPAGGPIETWVYAMVYTGFIVQGVGLMAAFALYARDRWPFVFAGGLAHPSRTRSFQTVVAWGALLVTAVLGGTRLFRAFGGKEGTTAVWAVQEGFKGLLVIAAAVALVVIARGRGSGPLWRPLVVAWLGAGAMFAWGLYAMIVRSVGGPLAGGGDPAAELVELFGMLTGLVMAMSGAFQLVERAGAPARAGSDVRDVHPAQQPLEREDREDDRHPADHGHR